MTDRVEQLEQFTAFHKDCPSTCDAKAAVEEIRLLRLENERLRARQVVGDQE